MKNIHDAYINIWNGETPKAEMQRCFRGNDALPRLMLAIVKHDPIELTADENTPRVIQKTNEKYSIVKTLQNILDTDKILFEAIFAVSHYKNRGDITELGGPGAKYRYSQLVPLFLSAYKEHSGINYNEWKRVYGNNKETNIFMRMASSQWIWDTLSKHEPYLYTNESDREQKRSIYIKGLQRADSKYNVKDYPRMNMTFTVPHYEEQLAEDPANDTTSQYTRLESIINSQVWHANVELRNKYTIKDIEYWDKCPDSFDSKNNNYREQGGVYLHDKELAKMAKLVAKRNAKKELGRNEKTIHPLFGEI